MIKINVLVLACLYILSGCREIVSKQQEISEIKNLGGIKMSPLIDSLFREYAHYTPNTNGYAIFIDKKIEGIEFMITIAPFKKKMNNFYEAGVVNYFLYYDTIPVFLYTGLEDFVYCDTILSDNAIREQTKIENKTFDKNVDFLKSWSYVYVDDTSYIVKGNSFPFSMPTLRPTVYFSSPKKIKE